VVDAAAVDNEVLYLAIVVVGDSLQCVEVGLYHVGHQWLLLTFRDVDLQLDGDRSR
jgi:hypothetical protein